MFVLLCSALGSAPRTQWTLSMIVERALSLPKIILSLLHNMKFYVCAHSSRCPNTDGCLHTGASHYVPQKCCHFQEQNKTKFSA